MSLGKRWNVKEATTLPTHTELAFAAGFMEGDGYFGKNKTTVSAEFHQKESWIIDKFQAWFGGAVGQVHKQGILKRSYWRWRISGDRARNFMRATFEYYSPKRQGQIKHCLGDNIEQV